MKKSNKQFLRLLTIIFTVTIFLLSNCKKDRHSEQDIIRIRIAEEPEMISPIFSKSSISGQLSEKIFLPLADYDPGSLKLQPVLIKEIPQPIFQDGIETYELELLDSIRWQDGTPLTVNDIITTYKLILNPAQEAASVRSTLKNLHAVIVDNNNNKKFKLQFKGRYHLDMEAALNIPIFQANTFNTNKSLEKYSVMQLAIAADSLMDSADSTELVSTAANFKNAFKDFRNLNGCGAYHISDWQPGQRIILEKVKNWWGNKYGDKNKLLTAFPQKLIYLLLPDELAASNALSNGQLDILPDMPATEVKKLTDNNTVTDKFTVGCPDVMQYYYIALNNASPALSDVAVRRALAELLDVEKIISTLMDGKATRIYGPILPLKSYYNAPAAPEKYNPENSKKLLENAGWKISAGNEVRSKIINGKIVKLRFEYLTTGKQLGKDLAALLANEAAKIGIQIIPKTMEFGEILKLVKTSQYDMANMVTKQFPGLDDPYLAWNSSNAFGKGTNVSNLQSPKIDTLTELIRNASDATIRNKYYKEFQSEIYKLQPVIFLFTPQNCILVRKDLDPQFSARRPGYFENTMQ